MLISAFPVALCGLVALSGGTVGFGFGSDRGTHTITDGGKPVLVYHHAWVDPPEGADKKFRRTGYIHPLYGLDGEILTQDFPEDHYHHRGVFWGWPRGEWKGKRLDTWGLSNSRQANCTLLDSGTDGKTAFLESQTDWILDEAPEEPIVRETVRIDVHEASAVGRAMDFTITLKNITDAPLQLKGALEENKGYGGFNFRPDATRKPMHFTTALGPQAEDTFEVASPWVDVSYATAPGAKTQSGAAIFQHPANPNYPHSHWLVRHYAFLGHAWPGNTPVELVPGKEITVKYRLYTHRGTAEEGKVAEAFDAYMKEVNSQSPQESGIPK
jgi:hypothetical protein